MHYHLWLQDGMNSKFLEIYIKIWRLNSKLSPIFIFWIVWSKSKIEHSWMRFIDYHIVIISSLNLLAYLSVIDLSIPSLNHYFWRLFYLGGNQIEIEERINLTAHWTSFWGFQPYIKTLEMKWMSTIERYRSRFIMFHANWAV